MAETFGKTVKGLTEWWASGYLLFMSKYTSGSAGTLKSLSLYIRYFVDVNIKCAIYDSSFNLLANGTTEEKAITAGQNDWLEFNFGTPPSVSATTGYYLALWTSSTVGNAAYFYRDANGAASKYRQPFTYGVWPDPFVGYSNSSNDMSIFATYEEAPAPPAPPTNLEVDGKSDPTGINCISDLTPGFTAIYNDPDAGDTSNAINIQVGTASGLSDMWDSGWLADSTVTPNRCTAKTYAGAALSAGTSYWWRCRFRDDENAEGAWSAWQQFDMCSALNSVQMALI